LRASFAVALLFAGGCGASKRFDGVVYKDEAVSFRVPPVPEGWRRIDVSDASLAFRDDARMASILVDGRCDARDKNTPLISLTQHLIIGTTDRVFVSQDIVPFDGREAAHTVLRAKLDGVEMQYDIFVLSKDGCIYDIVYVAPPDRFAEGQARFQEFAKGFHTIGNGAL
jgi:hypothetical protein